MNNPLLHLYLIPILLLLNLGQDSRAAENCTLYLSLLEEYQKDRQELLDCGIAKDDFFINVKPEEQAAWCTKATQAEIDQLSNQAGLPTLHCSGILHYFNIQSDTKLSERWGLINALYESPKLEPIPEEVRKAIITNPGKKTGAKLTPFPIEALQGLTPSCQLLGVKTTLSTDPMLIHWLVSAEAPCQRDSFNQSPFWLVEQQHDHYQVILAYRTGVLKVKTERHQGYSVLTTLHTLDNGNNDEVNLTWQYNLAQKQYELAASWCSNLARIDDTEPVFLPDCYKGETW